MSNNFMKIGLIHPSKETQKGMPLGLAAIAGYLKQKNNEIDFRFLDTGVYSDRDIRQFFNIKYDIIGITSSYCNFNEAAKIANYIKDKFPDTILVTGGPYTSIIYEGALKDTAFDFGIFGEGEKTFYELVFELRNKKKDEIDYAKIDGLIFRDNGNIIKNRNRDLILDLNSLPFPYYDLFPRNIIYKYGAISMETLRGCPFNCVFCSSSEIWGRKSRKKNVERAILEIKNIAEKYPKIVIAVCDDSFNLDKKWVNEFCDGIINQKKNIFWSTGGIRIDLIDPEMAKKIVLSGCSKISIGIESANPAVLKRINKHFTIDTVSKNIDMLSKTGFTSIAGQFIIGNPGDTLDTIKESIAFAKNSKLTSTFFYSAVPFPTTKLWDYVLKEGRFLVDQNVSNFDELSPRVIFETDEFPKSDRIEAINLAKKAGFYYDQKDIDVTQTTKKLRNILKTFLFSIQIGKINLGAYINYYLRKRALQKYLKNIPTISL
jgi:anaerobic magnesium-protoporphyrin IX monomethyl ester cyclase